MKITTQGIAQITCALDWADMKQTNAPRSFCLEDLTFSYNQFAGDGTYVIALQVDDDTDHDIVGHGETFDEAAADFYLACKTARER